jgi:hypothetical protein
VAIINAGSILCNSQVIVHKKKVILRLGRFYNQIVNGNKKRSHGKG